MKKSLVAVFSISITAGTIYLGYDQLKRLLIKRLIKSLEVEAVKKGKEMPAENLREELDRFYLWDLRLLEKLLQKISAGQNKEALTLKEKVKQKGLLEKADLKSIEELMLNT